MTRYDVHLVLPLWLRSYHLKMQNVGSDLFFFFFEVIFTLDMEGRSLYNRFYILLDDIFFSKPIIRLHSLYI